jgi:hypothetical protein
MARLRVSIVFESGARIGPGKVKLLESIRDTRSISAAARDMGVTGRFAQNCTLMASGSKRREAGEGAARVLITPSRKENQVSVRVTDDESAGAPRLGAERLMEPDTSALVFEEQRFGIVNCDRC